MKERTSLVLTLTTKLDAALGTIKVLGDKVGKLEELVSNNSEKISSILPPSVKDVHSQLQPAPGSSLVLEQEVHLLKASNKTLTDQLENLSNRIGDSTVDTEWGNDCSSALKEIGNHVAVWN